VEDKDGFGLRAAGLKQKDGAVLALRLAITIGRESVPWMAKFSGAWKREQRPNNGDWETKGGFGLLWAALGCGQKIIN
jgi:hypothetical protein